MHRQYSYEAVLDAAERIRWRVDDLIGGDKQLDFARPFMPDSLARVEGLEALSASERRTLNQIRGHGYLYVFGLVEEFILPFVLDHARPRLHADDHRTRALLRFAEEEAKHIHLFKRFREEFGRGFPTACEVIGPPEDVARAVLAHHPLGVALAILQIEWMTQQHYLESVRDDSSLDACFAELLRHHWMEEAQHAKLDTLVVEELASSLTDEEIAAGVEAYFGLIAFFEGGTGAQAQLDLEAFERATGRTLSAQQRETFVAQQHQALKWTYIGTGMLHPRFLETLDVIAPGVRARVEALAASYR